MSTSKLLLSVVATVGWLLALALALNPTPPPPHPVAQATPPPSLATEILHDQQLQSVIDDTRDQLVRLHPDKALESVSYAFSLCRARDQQPPAEVYQLFAEAYCQTLAQKETKATPAVTARRSPAKIAISAAPAVTSRPRASRPLTPPPEIFPDDEELPPPPRRPRQRPDCTLPQPGYPTAPPSAHQPPGPPEPPQGPADYRQRPPMPEIGYSDRSTPPPVPQGMPQPAGFPGPPNGAPPGPPPEGRRGQRPGPGGESAQLPYPPYSPSGSSSSPPGY